MYISCGFEPLRVETFHIDPAPATEVDSVQSYTSKLHPNSTKALSTESPPPINLDSWDPYSFKVFVEQSCFFPGVQTEVTVWGVTGKLNKPVRDEKCSKTFSSPGEIELLGSSFNVTDKDGEVDCESPGLTKAYYAIDACSSLRWYPLEQY